MNRPDWVRHLWMFVADEIIDEKYGYPMDGSDDELLEEIERAVNRILCDKYGHEIINDQCGIPDHRYCALCHRSITKIAGTEHIATIEPAWAAS